MVSARIDTANIWFYYDKNANDGIICGGLDFKEIIIRDRKAADPGMFHPSFLSELKTISEHKLDGDLPGSMVHYILSAGSISAAADLAERLSQKLFEAGRIESRRVGIVSGIKPDLFNRRNHLEDIIENKRRLRYGTSFRNLQFFLRKLLFSLLELRLQTVYLFALCQKYLKKLLPVQLF